MADPLKRFNHKYYAAGIVSLNWDIFNSFQTINEISSMRHLYKASDMNYKNTYLDVKVQVYSQIHNIEAALYSYLANVHSVKLAELRVEQAFIKREVGTITGLELRTAIQKLSNVRTEKNSASYALLISYFSLLELVGDSAFSSENGLADVF